MFFAYLPSTTQQLLMNEFLRFFFVFNSGFCFAHTLVSFRLLVFFCRKMTCVFPMFMLLCFALCKKVIFYIQQNVRYLLYFAKSCRDLCFASFYFPKDSDFSHALALTQSMLSREHTHTVVDVYSSETKFVNNSLLLSSLETSRLGK